MALPSTTGDGKSKIVPWLKRGAGVSPSSSSSSSSSSFLSFSFLSPHWHYNTLTFTLILNFFKNLKIYIYIYFLNFFFTTLVKVVTTRAHVHWVVTEYGAVNLYGKTLRERMKLLVSIAHPLHRPWLEKEIDRGYWKEVDQNSPIIPESAFNGADW